MAKAGVGAEPIMSVAELKPLLHLARRQSLNCAIAMGKDKQGLILLHRRTKPRKLLAELKRQAKAAGTELDPTSIRFGRAAVDGASDSAMVTFTVNKPAPGPMRRALLEQVRPAGFQRCEIVVDEALESETDDEDAHDGAEADHVASRGAGGAEPAPDAAIPAGSVTPLAARGGVAEAQGDPGGVGPASPSVPGGGTNLNGRANVGGLMASLLEVSRSVAPAIAANPSCKGPLIKLVTDAQACIKAGDAEAARTSIEALRQALPRGNPPEVRLPSGELGALQGGPVLMASFPQLSGTHGMAGRGTPSSHPLLMPVAQPPASTPTPPSSGPLPANGTGPAHPVAVPASPGDNERKLLDRAYVEMASQAGLSRTAAQEFVRRAPTLDDGHIHGPAAGVRQSGPTITMQQLQEQAATGHVRVAPTAAQSGLLQLLQAQDAGASVGTPDGAAAGLPLIRGASPGAPGNGAVTPQVAAELLRNMTEGRPPFRPELGKVGPVSWFITGGNPHAGTGADKSVALPVEVSNPTGKPPMRFNEAQLLEIYNAKMAEARALVEGQIRSKNDLTNGEELSGKLKKDLANRAHKVAERAMWTEVGNRTAASESGIGKVELKDSVFSRRSDGEFTLTSKADAVRIKGGAQALLDIIKEKGVPAEPAVLEAARKLAVSEKWVGRVQGAFRVGGKILIVVGVAADAYKIYTATDKAKAVAEVVAGWTAAGVAGGAFATAFAPADVAGPFAWAAHGIGTLIVGGVAYWVGSTTTRIIYELVIEGKPITIGPE